MSEEEVLATYKQYGIEVGDQRKTVESPGGGLAQAGGAGQVPPRAPKSDTAIIWKMHSDQTMEPVKISLGITDHAYTEVKAFVKGELNPGDDVVIRSITPKNQGPGTLRR
jgi:hypothetical protein